MCCGIVFTQAIQKKVTQLERTGMKDQCFHEFWVIPLIINIKSGGGRNKRLMVTMTETGNFFSCLVVTK